MNQLKNQRKKKAQKNLDDEQIKIEFDGKSYIVTSDICPNYKCIGLNKEETIKNFKELYQSLL